MAKLCPKLMSTGSCNTPSCKFRHDAHTCEPCGIICNSTALFNAHLQGKRHHKKVTDASTLFHCPICKVNVTGQRCWLEHVSGRRHQNEANRISASTNVQPVEADSAPGQVLCSICNKLIPERFWAKHPRSGGHLNKVRFMEYKAVLEEAEKDKHGVILTGDWDLGIVDVPSAQHGLVTHPIIKNSIPSSQIVVVGLKFASSVFSVSLTTHNRILTFGTPISPVIRFSQSYRGRYEDRIEIVFKDNQLNKQFVITRSMRVIVGDKADYELLRPTAPYIPRKRTQRQAENEVIPGELPPALKAVPYIVKLTKALIPRQVSSTLSTGPTSEIIRNVRRILLPSILDSEAYGRHFKNLLWIEENQMEQDLERYDIQGATMLRNSSFYFLSIPGLAEKRPSVLVGDRILVQKVGATAGHWYEGGVHLVRKEEVGLRFHSSFEGWTKEQKYNIRFKLNRYPMRRQHQALDTVFSPDRILFPIESHIQRCGSPSLSGIRVYNRLIATNPPQLEAITSILAQKPGAAPFAIFGPPGTGKTVTVVEAILQLLRLNPNARILACAPSNSAADLIAIRLTTLSKDDLFRFYAPTRSKEAVPDDLIPYSCRCDGESHFSCPILARLKRFRVIVTTCVSASFAYGVGMPRGHFTHIFLDEAGQATEPEAMISIKTMADNSTNIILSGDPKQLGPIIRSNVARGLGLETSYLERLMERELYDERQGHGVTVVKLIKNFRSHNAILKFPNERFYKGELQMCGPPKVINSYLGSPLLISKRFPIVFHAICGKDDREASSPSFFNVDEASQVKAYVQTLKADRGTHIADSDIGVITPYHAQCLKIRNILRAVADGIKVGSVEEFQGQERRVIIISTVRSSQEFVEYDLKHTLGFVANPRRFNVGVTRAQALLIVVGDPTVLSLDPLWRSFLNYIYDNDGWTGQPPTWNPETPVNENADYAKVFRDRAVFDMNDFTRKMEELTLAAVDADDSDDMDQDANVDRPWRDLE